MPSKTNLRSLGIAVVAAVAIGVAVGLGAGYLARAFDLPTGFVGPLTGGLVGGLTVLFYRLRERDGSGT